MAITINGDLILEADYKIDDNLIVNGDIKGKNGIRYNIDCGDINYINTSLNLSQLDKNNFTIGGWAYLTPLRSPLP